MPSIAAVFFVGVLIVIGVGLLGAIFEGVQSHAKDRYRSVRRHAIAPPELIGLHRSAN